MTKFSGIDAADQRYSVKLSTWSAFMPPIANLMKRKMRTTIPERAKLSFGWNKQPIAVIKRIMTPSNHHHAWTRSFKTHPRSSSTRRSKFGDGRRGNKDNKRHLYSFISFKEEYDSLSKLEYDEGNRLTHEQHVHYFKVCDSSMDSALFVYHYEKSRRLCHKELPLIRPFNDVLTKLWTTERINCPTCRLVKMMNLPRAFRTRPSVYKSRWNCKSTILCTWLLLLFSFQPSSWIVTRMMYMKRPLYGFNTSQWSDLKA